MNHLNVLYDEKDLLIMRKNYIRLQEVIIFLLYECEEISTFGTLKNVEILLRKTEWFCDETFDSAPLHG